MAKARVKARASARAMVCALGSTFAENSKGERRMSDAYKLGFEDGEKVALFCCFRHQKPSRDFYTRDEYLDYEDGYHDGYNSVDD